jgi:formylmethanofuran dehydrogenase subunit E
MNIDSYTFEEFSEKVRAFHGNASPGVVLGGIMVDVAHHNLPKDGLFDAISETDKCLPDAIQLLTPCTIGNGWMRIINTGRFALCLYDKHTGEGVRVFVDPEKVKSFQEINEWFYVLKPKKEQSKDRLMEEIKNHGHDIMSVHHVAVDISSFASHGEYTYATCQICKESCLADKDGICSACKGRIYISETKN